MNKYSYYNDNDPYICAWLRQLIKLKVIPDGEIDSRSIELVKSEDVKNFHHVHFFAGIATWAYALQQANWPTDSGVWTGSCPCQPFSYAGQHKAFSDKRHLWPTFFNLIKECHPPTIFGEQVASKNGLAWLDLVLYDLESQNYSVAAIDLPAAGFGAPHIRQRLYFVANSEDANRRPRNSQTQTRTRQIQIRSSRPPNHRPASPPRSALGSITSFWTNSEWLLCADRKYRPVEPSILPLAPRTARSLRPRRHISQTPISPNSSQEARMMRLKGYGNSLNAPTAIAFIKAFLEITET